MNLPGTGSPCEEAWTPLSSTGFCCQTAIVKPVGNSALSVTCCLGGQTFVKTGIPVAFLWFSIMWILSNSCTLVRERIWVRVRFVFLKEFGGQGGTRLASWWSFLCYHVGKLPQFNSSAPFSTCYCSFPFHPDGKKKDNLRQPSLSPLSLGMTVNSMLFLTYFPRCFKILLSSFHSYQIFSEWLLCANHSTMPLEGGNMQDKSAFI